MIQRIRAQPHGLARRMLYLEMVSLRAAVLSRAGVAFRGAFRPSYDSQDIPHPQQTEPSAPDISRTEGVKEPTARGEE